MKPFLRTFFILLFAVQGLHAQNTDSTQTTESEKKDWLRFNGYLKYMQTVGFSGDSTVSVDNLIHNRLNFRAFVGNGHSFVGQFRTRIFYGYSVNNVSGYGDLVNDYDGVIPLEWLVVDEPSVVMNIIADRLYYDYSGNKFQVRIGRQRINWGINTTWNPNDIFNSYNIYDFDYEEREGSDAIRIKFFPNYLSTFDLAYKFTGDFDSDVVSLLYKFNKKNYDYQLLVGKFEEKIAMGGGWAGSIKLVGFKGELTYFQPYNNSEDGNLSASTTFDYSWVNGFYLMGTYLFNTTGANHPIDPFIQIVEVPNAERLMPAKHNTMASASYQFSPIFTGNMGLVYSFEINSMTLFPTMTFSLKKNLDFDLVGQFFFQELPDEDFSNLGNGVFGRMKWSF